MRKIGFIFQYALKDLLPFYLIRAEIWHSLRDSVKNCLPASLNIISVSLLIVVSMVIGGIWIGARATLLGIISENPLVNRIEVSPSQGKVIGSEDLADLKMLRYTKDIVVPSEDEAIGPLAVTGVYPWHTASLWFYNKDGSEGDDFTDGRTIGIGDSILQNMAYLPGSKPFFRHLFATSLVHQADLAQGQISANLQRVFEENGYPFSEIPRVEIESPNARWRLTTRMQTYTLLVEKEQLNVYLGSNETIGCIVTLRLLKNHGYITQEEFNRFSNELKATEPVQPVALTPPEKLQVQYLDKPTDVPILAVANWAPDGEFLVTEGFLKQLREERYNPNPPYGYAFVGPIENVQGDKMLRTLQPYFDNLPLSYELIERIGTEKWLKLALPDGKRWLKSYFEGTIFPMIVKQLESAGVHATLQIEFDPPHYARGRPIQLEYINVSVYVSELDWIPATYNAIRELGLFADVKVVQNIEWIQQLLTFVSWIFIVMGSIVGVISGMNLFLTFSQTIARKIGEIGILMAFGSSKGLVTSIYLMEAFIIWLAAGVLGGFFSWWGGNRAEAFLLNVFQIDTSLELFQMPWQLIFFVMAVALAICGVSTFLASRIATKTQPAQAVRLK